jgi:hypothetical protein
MRNRDIRAYINPFVPGGLTTSGQNALFSPGAEVYIENKSGEIFNAFLRSLRKDDPSIVEVAEVHYIAPGYGKPRARRRALTDRIKAIRAAKATIVEKRRDRTSAANGVLHEMLFDAYEQIAMSGRARPGKRRGRPPTYDFTAHQWDVIEGMWHSRRYENDAERILAIKKQFGKCPGRSTLRNKFGSPHKRTE